MESQPFVLFLLCYKIKNNMGKSTHFFGQPLYGQVIKLLDKSKIFQISRENGGERYTKRFNIWVHLVVMLYAVIMRFDSLREITASLLGEARKRALECGGRRYRGGQEEEGQQEESQGHGRPLDEEGRVEHVFGYCELNLHGMFSRVIGFARNAARNTLTNLVYNVCRYEQIVRLGMN